MAIYNGTSGNDTLTGTSSADQMYGSEGNDSLTGSGGNDVLDGGVGADTMAGGLGNDTYYIDNLADIVTENNGEGTDTVYLSAATYNFTSVFVETIYLLGSAVTVTGNSLANTIRGNDNANVINALAGGDLVYGGNGNDTISAGDDNDIVFGDAGDDTLNGDLGTDKLYGGSGADVLNGGNGSDILSGGSGADTMAGGLGNDTFYIDDAGDIITENASEGEDRVYSEISYVLTANTESLYLLSTTNINATGNSLDNAISGNSGNNVLTGAAGNDQLNGDAGNDTMIGGTGNDSYYVDSALDVVTENAGEGVDYVYATVNYTLSATVEHLTLQGTSNLTGTGNSQDNNIVGNDGDNSLSGAGGNDFLNGAAGNDTMAGGTGNDVYFVDSDSDVVVENANEGTDHVRAYLTYTLVSNVEYLTLLGTSNLNGTGNTLDNTLRGNSGNNVLNGGVGRDLMYGGAGDDTYYVDNANDQTIEVASEGNDTVITGLSSYTLAANVENLIMSGTGANTVSGNSLDNALTGNSANNTLNGNGGNDTLDGNGGTDTMAGGIGNDVYYTDGGDTINENVGEGTDTVYSSVTYTLGSNIENLVLTGENSINGTGNADANSLTGNIASNTLDGGINADTLTGGDGDDTYVVDNAGDVVTEQLGEGIDLVQSSITYTLGNNVESLTLTGTGTINGTGNTLDNTITGNSLNNVLTALDGADFVYGMAGNDNIDGGNGDDFIYGDDTANTISGADTLLGGAGNDSMYGGQGTDSITGGSGNDILDGGAGVDTLTGGTNDDTYYVDSASDVLVENAGEGTDTVVYSVAGVTLAANFENLTITVSGAASGNSLDNIISANNGVANTLTGGNGNDTYYIDRNDTINADTAGTDTVNFNGSSGDTYTLASGLENLTLIGANATNATGNTAANIIIGNASNNRISGGGGSDTLQGGYGNDTYVYAAGITIIEAAGAGTDFLESNVSLNLGTLGIANVEGISLTTTGITATGSSGNDYLTSTIGRGTTLSGGNGNDILDSRAGGGTGDIDQGADGNGGDNLQGGNGSDTYIVSSWDEYNDGGLFDIGDGPETGPTIQDTVSDTGTGVGDIDTLVVVWSDHVEAIGGGDEVIDAATVDLTTGFTGIENVQFQGEDGRKGVNGNSLDNIFTGAGGANNLVGNDGNDSLYGNSGADTLNGGNGNDILDSGDDSDADSLTGGAGNDTFYIYTSSDVVVEAAGGGTDIVYSGVTHTLGTNFENLTLIAGTGDINATGNTGANVIVGNDGANVITGGGGADTMSGGAGNDTIVVDSLDDVISENNGEGTDTVSVTASINWTLGANFENLTLAGSGTGTGNSLGNTFSAQNGASNTLSGGIGNDVYFINQADTVIENSGEGTDTVYLNATAAGTYTIANNVEVFVLQGSTAGVNANGNTLDNGLWGSLSSAANSLIGGVGNDYYVVGAGDVVTETAGQGTDTVYIDNVAYTGTLDNVEYVYAYNSSTGALNFSAGRTLNFGANTTGLWIQASTFSDSITGGSGNDTIIGNGGSDSLNGGGGNDTYYTDGGDTISDTSGTDLVYSTGTYTLGAGLENLTLTGTANINATGNTLDNVLTGNSGTNTLTGLAGNDSYYITATDTVTEAAGAGTDTIFADFTCSIAAVANVENLTLIGTGAYGGTGNTLANVLTGNSGANTLDGGVGNDTMAGGLGDDVYYVDSASDVVTEAAGEGTDTVVTALNIALAANVEVIIATAASQTVTGNSLDNILTSQGAATTMIGLAGNDLYIIDSTDDIITEAAGAGRDSIQTSVNYTTSANVEDIQLIEGSAATTATGNSLDNTLVGNSNTNTLTGGAGDDTYFIDATADVVVELASEGTDTINSSATYTLSANVENLILLGTGTINGTGNTLDNSLMGGIGNNTLTGSGGNDTLAGGQGNDSLVGGTGNTTYTYYRDDAVDTINDTGGADILNFASADVGYAQLWFKQTGNDLEIDIVGTTDQVFVKDWFLSTSNQVETINSGDGYTLNNANVSQLVQAMAALTQPSLGQTGLPPETYDALELTFFGTWKSA